MSYWVAFDICTYANEILNILNKRLNSQIYIENQHLSKCRVRYFGLAFEMVKCRNTSVSHYLPAPESRGCISAGPEQIYDVLIIGMKIPMNLKPRVAEGDLNTMNAASCPIKS